MKNFFKKITSRKFLLALFGGIASLCVALSDIPSEKIKVIVTILGASSIILYQIVEGSLDLKALTLKKAQELLEEYKGKEEENK